MDIDKARSFIKDNPRAVLITRKQSGDPQTSPVVATLDDEGRLLISSRETAFKSKHLKRDPRATLCFFTSGFFGDWVQVDGTAEIVSLPDAMDLLIDYYRRLSGEHDDWDDYRSAMERDRRLIIRVTIERAGPDRSG